MKKLLNKELRLSAHILSYLFIAFAFMALIPGYPILVGAFFVCLGIFQSFQSARENNDILYTVLLPVAKSDAVKAKFAFTALIQLASFAISFALTMLRMTAMKDAVPYVSNAMMNANQFYLGCLLLVFALFNAIFLPGFFRTAYKLGKSFVGFIIASFVLIGLAETLHHLPGLAFLNGTDTMGSPIMWAILAACAVIYALVTAVSCAAAQKLFMKVDM